MRKVFTIAWRDFRQTVLRVAFLIGIIAIPVAIVVAIGAATVALLSHQQPPLVGTIVMITDDQALIAAARSEFEPQGIDRDRRAQAQELQKLGQDMMRNPGAASPMGGPSMMDIGLGTAEVRITIEHQPPDQADLNALKDQVRGRQVLALAIVPPELLAVEPGAEAPAAGRFELYVAQRADADHISFIERQLGKAVVRARAAAAGLDPDRTTSLLRRPDADTRRVRADGTETGENEGLREARRMIPMAFMMLIWIAVFTSSQHLLMATIEEKSNRVMEVLLSAVSPMQLMTGKILGQVGVGLLIVSIYGSVAVAGLAGFALSHLIEWSSFVYLFVYFFMAYFMIASIMAAVGSAVSDIREANSLVTPVMLIVMIPLLLWLPITHAPNGVLATVCSFIPPATPFVMILRVAADEPVPFWQIPATIVWGYLCVLAMVWMAARVFRVGVLMYGKPPSPLELIRWMRYS